MLQKFFILAPKISQFLQNNNKWVMSYYRLEEPHWKKCPPRSLNVKIVSRSVGGGLEKKGDSNIFYRSFSRIVVV